MKTLLLITCFLLIPASVSAAPVASVRINPEGITAIRGGGPVYLSTLAYDSNNQPVWTGVTYSWHMSSTNSIGNLKPNLSNDKIAAFLPSLNSGSGDIGITATDSQSSVSTSILVRVGIPGDLNSDDHVNLADLLQAIGIKNILTYNQVLANYGK